ncbi:hypothetical protein M0805_004422, partial [Coniferiporia weirii]
YNRGSTLQDRYMDKSKKTDVLEVWFAGCHTDVGGGSVANDTRNSLARIPLRWMIRQCFLTECGIQFEADRLLEVAGIDPHTLYPIVLSRPEALPVSSIVLQEEAKKASRKDTSLLCKACSSDKESDHAGSEDGTVVSQVISEEHEELHDALSPAFDQLEKRRAWWILEFIPLIHLQEKDDGTNVKVISINCGRARVVTQQHEKNIKVHRSVKMRMEAEKEVLGEEYKPRVKFACDPTWVD